MRICFVWIFGLLIPSMLWAVSPPTANEILTRIDQNRTSEYMISTSSFTIHSPRGSRTIKSKSWSQGEDRSFTQYLAPAREKGTKMLKVKNKLWIYYPRADRIVKISGHMLRQPVMGSDLSYEDMMENPELIKVYDASIEGNETIFERPCWILSLKAKKSNVAYQGRKIWVDQERYVSLKEELYTKRGKLLKTIEIRETFQVQSRWYPKRMWFKDMLKQGKGTEMMIIMPLP